MEVTASDDRHLLRHAYALILGFMDHAYRDHIVITKNSIGHAAQLLESSQRIGAAASVRRVDLGNPQDVFLGNRDFAFLQRIQEAFEPPLPYAVFRAANVGGAFASYG